MLIAPPVFSNLLGVNNVIQVICNFVSLKSQIIRLTYVHIVQIP
jgi:hypothetical protein